MPGTTDQKRRVEVWVDGCWRYVADAEPLFQPGRSSPYAYACPDVEIVVQSRLNGRRTVHRLGLVLVLRAGRLVNMFDTTEKYRLC